MIGEGVDDGHVVGIYVGNTNCCVAVSLHGGPEIIYTDPQNRSISSDVIFIEGRDPELGSYGMRVGSSIYAVKRMIGMSFDDPLVHKLNKEWPIKIVEGEDSEVGIVVENSHEKIYSPAKILAIIMSILMKKNIMSIRGPIRRVIFTVPAYFNGSQLQIIKEAAALEIVEDLHIVDEPIAIVLAYGLDQKYNDYKERNVIVFQIGGYTLSTTVVEIRNTMLKVKATTTNIEFGGNNFNDMMVEIMLDKFKHDKSMDSKASYQEKRKLWESVENAKIYVSENHSSADIEIEGPNNEIIHEKLTHADLEDWSKDLFRRCIELAEQCFRKAELQKHQICEVVLVGGASRLPMIREMLQKFFLGKELHADYQQPEVVVACGAATLGARLSSMKDHWTQNGRNGAFKTRDLLESWDSEEEEGANGPVIGIDFGTTNSCVAAWDKGRTEIIVNNDGNRLTPSCVVFIDDDEVLIGDVAKNYIPFAENVIFGVKRLIGKKFSKLSKEEIKSLPFEVIEEDDDEPIIVVEYEGEKHLQRPHEICSMILMELKKYAEMKLNQGPIKNIVVTIPAYFTNSQRKAMNAAAAMAEFNILCFIDEPTAAAIAYGLEKKYNCHEKKIALIFDLGSGTLDVSLLELQNNNIQVNATSGNSQLGGDDFDRRMMEYLIKIFKSRHKEDISDKKRSITKLRKACEEAKKQLSIQGRNSVTIEIESLYKGIDFIEEINRTTFEEINVDLFLKCMEPVKTCLEHMKIEKEKVDEIVLIGGSSRIPKIRKLLQEIFQGKELCCTFQPDEAVAYGAAILGAKLGNEILHNFDLKDTTTLVSLGVEDKNGEMLIVVPRNTPYPITKAIKYRTIDNNHSSMSFKVYEGERTEAKENNLLGSFNLEGIMYGRTGAIAVDLCFVVDDNGMVQVTAMDNNSGQITGISITDEVRTLNKMLKDEKKATYRNQHIPRKLKNKMDLEKYAELVSNKLNETMVTSRLGEYVHDHISYAATRALEWSKTKGQETKTKEFMKTMENLKTILQPYGNDIGLID